MNGSELMGRTARQCLPLALLISAVVAGLSAAQATGADPLAQQCIAAALKKPAGVKVSVRHAGSNSGRHQAAVLTGRYEAMPEACIGKYSRGNHAKAQVFRHGRWTRMNSFEPLFGAPLRPNDENGSYIDNQTSFTGRYEGLALVVAGEEPRLFSPCRVRILLKEDVTRPVVHTDDGYHPTQNVAQRIYAFPAPLSRIWPHRGQSCKLLAAHRYPVKH